MRVLAVSLLTCAAARLRIPVSNGRHLRQAATMMRVVLLVGASLGVAANYMDGTCVTSYNASVDYFPDKVGMQSS